MEKLNFAHIPESSLSEESVLCGPLALWREARGGRLHSGKIQVEDPELRFGKATDRAAITLRRGQPR